MEIYKLKDNVPDGRKLKKNVTDGDVLDERKLKKKVGDGRSNDGLNDSSLDGKKLIITNLKTGVKNPNRVNVYVNDEYVFSLDVTQVVDLKVKVGKEISEEDLQNYKNESEYGKLYQRALEWVLIRPRSKKELYDYLYRKRVQGNHVANDSGLFERIVERLVLKGYVDDERFAEWYVENRFVKKGVSQKRLRMELIKKGITSEVIDEVLANRNDEDEIKKIISRKRAKYDDQKLMAYLCSQGFKYDTVRKLVEGNGMEW